MADKCEDHTGCLKDIAHLQESDRDQWVSIKENRMRADTILARINVVLGGITVACVLLVVNIFIGR